MKRLVLIVLLFGMITPVFSGGLVPRVHADYGLSAVPSTSPEGNTVNLVLSVSAAIGNLQYRFRFFVTDPASRTVQSGQINYTTAPGQTFFQITVPYPGPSLSGSNTLVGQYNAKVDELYPTAIPGAAGTSFTLTITDHQLYQRTQTVNIQAAGYNVSESVMISIRTQTSNTLVFSQLMAADNTGGVSANWKIPVNAVIDNYVVSIVGTSTVKVKPDTVNISVWSAIMTINTITVDKPSYHRTDIMKFSFQPTYPDGTIASTGSAILTLAPRIGATVSLTATYNSTSQNFETSYKLLTSDFVGTWNASLAGYGYSDSYGNSGPWTTITSSNIPVSTAILSVNIVTASSTVNVGQQLRFNATITFPDGSTFQSGNVKAYLVYGGTPSINDSLPIVYDQALKLWIGSYTVRSQDTGGLWSLIVTASDSPTIPPNIGSSSRAITVQNTNSSSGGGTSLPLYYFGIIAALIAALLASLFVVFKRRKGTQTSLKIDFDAVKSEAGKIESGNFFQSVRDQVKKDKPD